MYAIQLTSQDKVVLLENVSVIMLDDKRNRVVFNYMSPINIIGRWTPDYTYEEYDTAEDAVEAFEKLVNHPHIKLNFFVSENPDNKEIVSKKAITTITYPEDKNRIIFNLNYSITSHDTRKNKDVEISKFIFWDYDNEDTMENDILEINETLNHIIEI